MNITILCSSSEHPVNEYLKKWAERNSSTHFIDIVNSVKELNHKGDILFLISCSDVITEEVRNLYKTTLVIHASDLPKGRGWSPHVWGIIEGASEITVSLLEVANKVDSGDVWQKIRVPILKTDVYDEINSKLFKTEMELMSFAINHYDTIKPAKQNDAIGATYYEKRTPKHSELDIKKSIEDNFNLLRVCDPARFPAFFYFEGVKYKVYLEKEHDDK